MYVWMCEVLVLISYELWMVGLCIVVSDVCDDVKFVFIFVECFEFYVV